MRVVTICLEDFLGKMVWLFIYFYLLEENIAYVWVLLFKYLSKIRDFFMGVFVGSVFIL